MDNHQIGNRRDIISEFPDDLLLKILSFLPSKNVVATSLLSQRWKSLWKELKTFRFDVESSSTRFYKKFMLLLSKRSYVESLDLKLDPAFMKSDIKLLVCVAIRRSLRELRLELLYSSFEFPQKFYAFSQLETLILVKLSLVDVPTDVPLLICLKRLHLLSVKFSGDESVKTFLSICPSLEELVVRRSTYTNVMIFTIDLPTLKSLSIDNTSGTSRPNGVHGFVINAPSLRCFSIIDSFSNYLEFGNMPELVKTSVNVVCDQPDKFLGSLSSTQYLSLCSVTLQTGTSFLFLDHLELCLCSMELWNLFSCILNGTPRLRILKLKLYEKHCVQYSKEMDPWNLTDCIPECLSSNLEIFEWRGYNGTEKEREAAKYILGNSRRLKKARFYSKSAEKHEMLKELESLVRDRELQILVEVMKRIEVPGGMMKSLIMPKRVAQVLAIKEISNLMQKIQVIETGVTEMPHMAVQKKEKDYTREDKRSRTHVRKKFKSLSRRDHRERSPMQDSDFSRRLDRCR